jgi:hypothetical protein
MDQSGYRHSTRRHFLCRYGHCILYGLSPIDWRPVHILCPLSQMKPAQSQASQVVVTAPTCSYRLFSCLCLNWVCQLEHRCAQIPDSSILGLMSLTLIHAIQGWQMAHGRLYVVLVKNNILYYLCGLCESKHAYIFTHFSMLISDDFVSEVLSAVNVLASRYFPVRDLLKHCRAKTLIFRTLSTSTMPCSKGTHFQICLCIPTNNTHPNTHLVTYSFQFVFLQILALRMHLHLWQIDQQTQNMDSLVCISLSDM